MAQTVDFATVDVFTSQRYSGNPLAIVKLPNDATITQEQKQLIAREFSLSETVFLHLPAVAENTWDVDIFTTYTEIAFAGHPTIGTAFFVLSDIAAQNAGASGPNGTVRGAFNCKAGRIKLEYDAASGNVTAGIPQNFHIHQRAQPAVDILASQHKLRVEHFAVQATGSATPPSSFPVASIVNGMTFILVELRDLEALAMVNGSTEYDQVQLDEGWSRTLAVRYFYVRLPDAEDGSKRLRTRMIMVDGEDPATGSAASDLSCYLSQLEGKAGQTIQFRVTQGVEMGRESNIGVKVTLADDDAKKIEKVELSGTAVQAMQGSLPI